jgi:hypothetical protein
MGLHTEFHRHTYPTNLHIFIVGSAYALERYQQLKEFS